MPGMAPPDPDAPTPAGATGRPGDETDEPTVLEAEARLDATLAETVEKLHETKVLADQALAEGTRSLVPVPRPEKG